jgi:hypothetical protein
MTHNDAPTPTRSSSRVLDTANLARSRPSEAVTSPFRVSLRRFAPPPTDAVGHALRGVAVGHDAAPL